MTPVRIIREAIRKYFRKFHIIRKYKSLARQIPIVKILLLFIANLKKKFES